MNNEDIFNPDIIYNDLITISDIYNLVYGSFLIYYKKYFYNYRLFINNNKIFLLEILSDIDKEKLIMTINITDDDKILFFYNYDNIFKSDEILLDNNLNINKTIFFNKFKLLLENILKIKN